MSVVCSRMSCMYMSFTRFCMFNQVVSKQVHVAIARSVHVCTFIQIVFMVATCSFSSRKGPVQAFFYVYISRIVSGDTGTFLLIE